MSSDPFAISIGPGGEEKEMSGNPGSAAEGPRSAKLPVPGRFSCLLVLVVYGASFFLPGHPGPTGEGTFVGWAAFLECLSVGDWALLGLLPHLLLWLGIFLLGLGKWRGAAAAGGGALTLGLCWLLLGRLLPGLPPPWRRLAALGIGPPVWITSMALLGV